MKKMALFLMGLCLSSAVLAEKIPFNWENKRAMVTETKEKDGKSLTVEYPIELKKYSDNWQLHFGQAKFVKMNGENIPPVLEQILQKAFSQSTLKPNLVIDKSGNPVEIIDWKEYLQGLGKVVPQSQNLINNLSSMPEFEQLLYVKALSEPWCLWVCNWTDNDFQKNPSSEQDDSHIAGIKFKEKNQYRLLEKKGNFITVEMKSQADITGLGDKNLLTNQPLTQQEKDELKKAQIMRETIITATFHQKTGEPQKVVSKTQVLQKNQVVRNENTTYEFNWQ